MSRPATLKSNFLAENQQNIMKSSHTTKHFKQSLLALLLTGAITITSIAGTSKKWEEVPEAVRKTVLANGGVTGQTVDDEGKKIDGKEVYEASVKGKDGKIADLVITEDGKLVQIKHDDEGDRTQEQETRAKKLLSGVNFSHPSQITNPWLPLSSLKEDILEGTEAGKKVRIERTVDPEKHKTFIIAGQKVEALVMVDREFEDGELEESTADYFVQDDNGTVYYLGEEVDEYKDGKVVGHKGAWMLGKDTQVPGVILPGNPKVGDRFMSEDVSEEIKEVDEVVSISETITVPAGTYKDCIKVKELLAEGTTEFKYYAKGIGVVREVPPDSDVVLKSHKTR